jgi:hypothetical protein
MFCPIHGYDVLDNYLHEKGCRSAPMRKIVAAQVGEVRGHYLAVLASFTAVAKIWIKEALPDR